VGFSEMLVLACRSTRRYNREERNRNLHWTLFIASDVSDTTFRKLLLSPCSGYFHCSDRFSNVRSPVSVMVGLGSFLNTTIVH
jgi:hypothetical protein